MKKPVHISVVDQIQLAEKRYYVALQQYDKGLKSPMTSAGSLERLRVEVCAAFAELSAAHNRLIDCDPPLPVASNDPQS